MEFIARTPPGKALDLGCGTGTNAITLARHGWRVTGVDFTYRKPSCAARRKAAAERIDDRFHVASVTDLSVCSRTVDDYVLDIGCLHHPDFARSDAIRHEPVPIAAAAGLVLPHSSLLRRFREWHSIRARGKIEISKAGRPGGHPARNRPFR